MSDECRNNGLAQEFIDKCVIIRSNYSGVHFGILEQFDPENNQVLLKDSRAIWYWSGAFTLYKVATSGIKEGKLSCISSKILITEVIEIIPCTQESIECLSGIKAHNE